MYKNKDNNYDNENEKKNISNKISKLKNCIELFQRIWERILICPTFFPVELCSISYSLDDPHASRPHQTVCIFLF